MKRTGFFAQFIAPKLHGVSRFIAGKLRNRFYIYLALLFSIAALLDATVFHLIGAMNQKAFDLMIRHRIVKPAADKDIVIVDIDEASLNAMAKEYGRWPWPRQVLGEFLEHIEKQNPRAVVFDILFSDADVFNPDSDAYFDAAIEATNNTFFPMLRLSEDNDPMSELMPWDIPGITMMQDEPKKASGIALVLPHFKSALAGGRLGTHNIYPDNDGIVRQYRIFRNDYGWKIPSLPLRIALELKFPMPSQQDVLLNWRGKPFSYSYASFNEVYSDFLSREKKRPPNEFKEKIVIIGSTAPSLFDVKATSMAKLHPGVEILATAIDNLKHDDYLRLPQSRIPHLILALAMVWAIAVGFFLSVDLSRFDRVFSLSQVVLLSISYASINLTNTYIDLTAPVTIAIAFFSLARVYAAATEKALETDIVAASYSGHEASSQHGTLMIVQITVRRDPADNSVLRSMKTELKKMGTIPKNVDYVMGEQKGIWNLLEGVLVISWVCPAHDEKYRASINGEIETIAERLAPLVEKYAKTNEYKASYVVQEGVLPERIPAGAMEGEGIAKSAWRQLLADGIRQLGQARKE